VSKIIADIVLIDASFPPVSPLFQCLNEDAQGWKVNEISECWLNNPEGIGFYRLLNPSVFSDGINFAYYLNRYAATFEFDGNPIKSKCQAEKPKDEWLAANTG